MCPWLNCLPNLETRETGLLRWAMWKKDMLITESLEKTGKCKEEKVISNPPTYTPSDGCCHHFGVSFTKFAAILETLLLVAAIYRVAFL